jgi:cation diffusion facilitator family transporter
MHPTARAATVSLTVGASLFLVKALAWWWTGSAALGADALESTVNVLAAGFALFAVRFGAEAPDEAHPYGHGKVEQLSAAFEGGLVGLAALGILANGAQALLAGATPTDLGSGLALSTLAAGVNSVLGAWLLAQGRRHGSAALRADGHHVLSDVWTSVGVVLGLGLAAATGWWWLDPALALAFGALLAVQGARLTREAASALIDEQDPDLVQSVYLAFSKVNLPGVSHLHRARLLQAGRWAHVDAHVVVPRFWSVAQAHAAAAQVEAALLAELGRPGEVALHLDPCQPEHCPGCALQGCPSRSAPPREEAPRRPSSPRR